MEFFMVTFISSDMVIILTKKDLKKYFKKLSNDSDELLEFWQKGYPFTKIEKIVGKTWKK